MYPPERGQGSALRQWTSFAHPLNAARKKFCRRLRSLSAKRLTVTLDTHSMNRTVSIGVRLDALIPSAMQSAQH